MAFFDKTDKLSTHHDVAAAGAAAGYWQALPVNDRHVNHVDVITPQGVRFMLSTVRGYGTKKTTIRARLASLRFEHGLYIDPSDVRSGMTTEDAQCSADRDPAAIAKDLARRVTAHAGNLAHGAAMLEQKARRLAEWSRLRREIVPFEALGYTFQLSEQEHYRARGHRNGGADSPLPWKIEVFATGRVDFDFSGSAATGLAILEALAEEEKETQRRAA